MRYIFLLSVIFFARTSAHAQVKEATMRGPKLLTPVGATLSLSVLENGKYSFSYANSMGGKSDFRAIVFKNKKEAKNFIFEINKSMNAKDGVSSLLTYPNYKIRLLSEIGGVFMMVSETGKSQSTFRITKENFDQVNVL